MSLEITKNEAIADIEYFIHEIEESGLNKSGIEKLEKGIFLIKKSKSEVEVHDYLSILTNIFQKAF